MKLADIKQLPPPSVLGFEGATGWDIFLLLSASILIAGEMILLYRGDDFSRKGEAFID